MKLRAIKFCELYINQKFTFDSHGNYLCCEKTTDICYKFLEREVEIKIFEPEYSLVFISINSLVDFLLT